MILYAHFYDFKNEHRRCKFDSKPIDLDAFYPLNQSLASLGKPLSGSGFTRYFNIYTSRVIIRTNTNKWSRLSLYSNLEIQTFPNSDFGIKCSFWCGNTNSRGKVHARKNSMGFKEVGTYGV